MFYDNRELGFAILGVYRTKGKPQTLNERNRAHTALSLRIKGDSSFFCNGVESRALDGTAAYFPRGVDYVRRTYSDEELLIVHLTSFGEEGTAVETADGFESLIPLFEALHREWEGGTDGSYNRCMSLLYKIFEGMERLAHEERMELPAAIAKGVEYLREHFRDPELSVSLLAEKCHVSETYFRRVYRKHYGISPVQAISDMRFGYARDLLRSGYYHVKEVAALSGFSDTKYFRAAFKAKHGMTPNEYAAQKQYAEE